jgi:hypothetical protein
MRGRSLPMTARAMKSDEDEGDDSWLSDDYQELDFSDENLDWGDL